MNAPAIMEAVVGVAKTILSSQTIERVNMLKGVPKERLAEVLAGPPLERVRAARRPEAMVLSVESSLETGSYRKQSRKITLNNRTPGKHSYLMLF